MTFVDAFYNQKKNLIHVVERDQDGNRHFVDYDAEHVFYYTHPSGSVKSMYGDSVRKFSTNDSMKFRKEIRQYRDEVDRNGHPRYKIFEADINPVFRCLENNYLGLDAPTLNVAFYDIETGYHSEKGFAPVNDPFNEITAITTYLSHLQKNITLVLRPNTITLEEGREICQQFEDTFLFDDEREMLRTFMAIIEDSDVITGWNSSTYDIPYTVNRIKRVLDEDATRGLCLWKQKPRDRTIVKYGREHESYDLVGRVHLDYLELYQKHNPQQQHSYRLDYIGEIEVQENKIPYEGNLDDLYKKDFKKFIEYNRQDVMLMVKIDQKKKFIDLANQIAHVNCVPLKTTMGSVALVEQAIILEMHKMGLVAPCRKPREDQTEDEDNYEIEEIIDDVFGDEVEEYEEDETEYRPKVAKKDKGKTPVVGAFVAKPQPGLHEHVAAVDINSLYPSAIRALNISPETILGQVRLDQTMAEIERRINVEKVKRADAWDGIFEALEITAMHEKRHDVTVTVDFEDGDTRTMSAKQLYDYIFQPGGNRCISANGTIFRTDRDGIIPGLLAKWYKERQELQALKGLYGSIAKGIEIEDENLLAEVQKLLEE